MSGFAETQQPSPALFFETMNAYQRTAALKGAIELDVFTAIAEGNKTAAALASRCATSERGMRILCDYLVISGFLTKDQNQYALTIDSEVFLNRHSPGYLGGAVQFIGSRQLVDAYKHGAAIVREGGPVIDQQGAVAPEHPIWVDFARGMAPLMSMPAEMLGRLIGADRGEKWKVLDIAAGHGLFGVTIAKQNPNAEIVAVDWAGVLAVAEENANAAGGSDSYPTFHATSFHSPSAYRYPLPIPS